MTLGPRSSLVAATVLATAGCTGAGGVTAALQQAGPSAAHAALQNGAAADAVFFQLSDAGRGAFRTDAGGFESPVGLAVAAGQLFVADDGDARVLRYDSISGLSDGADADGVLLQDDMFTIWPRFVPWVDRFGPASLAIDSAGRLYVAVEGAARVVVFADSSSSDPSQYELQDLSSQASSVRAMGQQRVATVTSAGITYYNEGEPAPLASGALSVAQTCNGSTATDVAEAPNAVLVACESGLPCQLCCCPDGSGGCASYACTCATPTDACAGVVAFAKDTATDLPVGNANLLYVLRTGSAAVPTAYSAPLRLVVSSDKLFVVDHDKNRILRFSQVGSHITDVFAGTASAYVEGAADVIYGQPDAFSGGMNYAPAGAAVTASGLSRPFDAAIDNDGNLWADDGGNARVLRYGNATTPSPSTAATLVLGQSNFTLGHYNRVEAGSVGAIGGIATDPTSGQTYVSDTSDNRVLIFSDIEAASSGADPIGVLGQPTLLTFGTNTPNRTPAADNLAEPSGVAVDPDTGYVYVADSLNNRILVYRNVGADPTATDAQQVIGASDLSNTGANPCLSFSALAVRSGTLFAAAGVTCTSPNVPNRIFVYDVSGPANVGACNAQVMGEDTPASRCAPDSSDAADHGRGYAGPDGFNDITGLAIDDDGGLWVSDSGNHRVLYFSGALAAGDLTSAIADGVVGQASFSATTPNAGANQTNRGGLASPGGVAVDGQGRLWVADTGNNRVLVFHVLDSGVLLPPDPQTGLMLADAVLGQADFVHNQANRNAQPNAATMDSPQALDLGDGGRMLLVGDTYNYRMLRFIDNAPPVVTGGGTYLVTAGGSLDVPLTVTDPDGDATSDATLVDPIPPGVSISNNVVTYDATGAAIGTQVRARIVVNDLGPRAQSTSTTVVFRVVAQAEIVHGEPPPPSPSPRHTPGCECNDSSGGAVSWLTLGLLGLLRRRRDRRPASREAP